MIKNFKLFLESKKEKFPNIKTLDVDGFEVLLGKDAKSNDYLSIEMANPEDWWFHAKGVPGSHVLLRNVNGITKEVKRKVAELAAKNSKCKTFPCKVVCCKAKFVSKQEGMNPGQVKVSYSDSEEFEVN